MSPTTPSALTTTASRPTGKAAKAKMFLARLLTTLQSKPEPAATQAILAQARKAGLDPQTLMRQAQDARPREWSSLPADKLTPEPLASDPLSQVKRATSPTVEGPHEASLLSELSALMNRPGALDPEAIRAILARAEALGVDWKRLYRDAISTRQADLPKAPMRSAVTPG